MAYFKALSQHLTGLNYKILVRISILQAKVKSQDYLNKNSRASNYIVSFSQLLLRNGKHNG
jgi:hypothetical protein